MDGEIQQILREERHSRGQIRNCNSVHHTTSLRKRTRGQIGTQGIAEGEERNEERRGDKEEQIRREAAKMDREAVKET